MTYELIDYVGDQRMVLNSIKIATEKLNTRQGQAAISFEATYEPVMEREI